jgi:hypothetical protein
MEEAGTPGGPNASHRHSPASFKSHRLKDGDTNGTHARGNQRVKTSFFALTALAAAAVMSAGTASGSERTLQAYRHIQLDGHRVKWGGPEAGAGAVVTYATLDRAIEFPEARNCRAMAPVGPMLAANGVAAATFEAELRQAFDLWSAVADIRFVPAKTAAAADILIGAQAEPRGKAFTNVEFDRSGPPGGFRTLTRSTICFSPAERWKIGFDGNLEVYDLRYTLLHEIGHAIGLDHPAIDSQLMDFRYSERFRTPQRGDVLGVVALYGPSGAVAAAAGNPGPQPQRVVRVGAVRPETGG